MKHFYSIAAVAALLLAGCLTGTDTTENAVAGTPSSAASSSSSSSTDIASLSSALGSSAMGSSAVMSSAVMLSSSSAPHQDSCHAVLEETILMYREVMGDGTSDTGSLNQTAWAATLQIDSLGYHIQWSSIVGPESNRYIRSNLFCPNSDTVTYELIFDTIRLNFGDDSLVPMVSRDFSWNQKDSLQTFFSQVSPGQCASTYLPGIDLATTSLTNTAPRNVLLTKDVFNGGSLDSVVCLDGQVIKTSGSGFTPTPGGSANYRLNTLPQPSNPTSDAASPDNTWKLVYSVDSDWAAQPWGLVATNPYGFTDTLWVVPPTQP